jgi:hypothetical protein
VAEATSVAPTAPIAPIAPVEQAADASQARVYSVVEPRIPGSGHATLDQPAAATPTSGPKQD